MSSPPGRTGGDGLLPGPGQALAAFLLYWLPAYFVWSFLTESGIVRARLEGQPLTQEQVEWGLLCQAVNCLCVIVFWRLQPPGIGLRPARTGRALLSYLAFLLLWVPLLLLYLQGMRAIGHPVQAQPHLLYFAAADWGRPGLYLALLVVAVLGPLAEELVFRGYLHGAVRLRAGRHAAVWSVALVFGLVHGLDKALPLFALGVLFGYLREATGSLWAPFLAHTVHNVLNVTVVLAWPETLLELYPR